MTSNFEAVETVVTFVATFMLLSISVVSLLATVNSVTQTTSQIQEESYRSVAVAENLLTSGRGSTPHRIQNGRSALNAEYLRKKSKVSNGHCFIPQVTGLDGKQFAYYLINTQDSVSNPLDFLPRACTQNPESKNASFSSPAVIRKSGETLEASVVVYALG